jgi:hypothetical protein
MEQENAALALVERDEHCALVASVTSSIGSTDIDPFGYMKEFEGWSKQIHVISGVKTGKCSPLVSMHTLAKKWKIPLHQQKRRHSRWYKRHCTLISLSDIVQMINAEEEQAKVGGEIGDYVMFYVCFVCVTYLLVPVLLS